LRGIYGQRRPGVKIAGKCEQLKPGRYRLLQVFDDQNEILFVTFKLIFMTLSAALFPNKKPFALFNKLTQRADLTGKRDYFVIWISSCLFTLPSIKKTPQTIATTAAAMAMIRCMLLGSFGG
jgi:hypothetical protein